MTSETICNELAASLLLFCACAFQPAQAQSVSVGDATCMRLVPGSVVKAESLRVESGGTMLLESDCELYVAAGLAHGGTFTATSGSTVNFNGSGQEFLTGATTFSNVTVSGGGTLSLNDPVSVNGTLELASGKISLGSSNLTIGSSGSITGNSSTRFIVTNGTGSLWRTAAPPANVSFPVGPTSTSYNPATVSNAGTTDMFSVRVQSTFDNPPSDPNSVVNRQWTIAEAVPGGSNATVVLQWNTADEAGSFNRNNPLEMGRFNGDQWEASPASFVDLGGGTYSATESGFTQFSAFSVGNTQALPIQLASFTAHLNGVGVMLDWTTISEVNNYGFNVQRRAESEANFTEIPSSFTPGHGTTTEPQHYSFIDTTLTLAGLYHYRLKQLDLDGSIHYSQSIDINYVVLAVQPDEGVPHEFRVLQNYPNPFNPTTTIKFSVERSEWATLIVYNVLGQEVATLFDGAAEPGRYYKVGLNGSALGSGVYFYRIATPTRSEVKKMLLLK